MSLRRRRAAGKAARPEGRALATEDSQAATSKAAGPQSRWRRLVATGLFDPEFYAAVSGETFDRPARLARHAVREGMPRLLPVHPLIDPRWLPAELRAAWRTGDIDEVAAHLVTESAGRSAWGPLFDPRAIARQTGRGDVTGQEALEHLMSLRADASLPRVHSRATHEVTWGVARPALVAAARQRREQSRWLDRETGAVQWDAVADAAAERVPGRVSIVIPTYEDVAMTRTAVAALLEAREEKDDLEIIVVDNGSSREVALEIQAEFFGLERVSVLRLEKNTNFSGGSNSGLAIASGELVLFLNNDTVVRPGWLDPLKARLIEPGVRGVQPLLLYPDDTIQAAGTVFLAADSLGIHLLAGHPRADAAGVGSLEFSAITAAAMLVRARDVIALHGFDTVYENGMEDVDFCLRVTEQLGGYFVVEPTAVIEHHEGKSPGRNAKIPQNRRAFLERWRGRLPAQQSEHYRALGFHIAHVGSGPGDHPAPRPLIVRPARRTRVDGEPVHVLRWGIKSPVEAGLTGEQSPISAAVRRLTSDLEDLGQEVVEYRAGTHRAPATALDDVSLVVRGKERAWAYPGKVNVLWAMEGTADLMAEELGDFDILLLGSKASVTETRHIPTVRISEGVRRIVEEVVTVQMTKPVLAPPGSPPGETA